MQTHTGEASPQHYLTVRTRRVTSHPFGITSLSSPWAPSLERMVKTNPKFCTTFSWGYEADSSSLFPLTTELPHGHYEALHWRPVTGSYTLQGCRQVCKSRGAGILMQVWSVRKRVCVILRITQSLNDWTLYGCCLT